MGYIDTNISTLKSIVLKFCYSEFVKIINGHQKGGNRKCLMLKKQLKKSLLKKKLKI